MTNCCAWPDCKEEGTFPAPRSPRDIDGRQYFCQPHIKEFNKRWNGLDGFSMDEIFDMQHGGATWNRPTAPMGINSTSYNAATSTFNSAEDLYKFFKQRQVNGADVSEKPEALPEDVQEACAIFALKAPTGAKNLKTKYLELVKKNHPDVAPDASPDVIKRINVAYKILQEYAA